MPFRNLLILIIVVLPASFSSADEHALLQEHCGACHSGGSAEGDFDLSTLGSQTNNKNKGSWLSSLNHVKSGEMPPADDVTISKAQREKLVQYLKGALLEHSQREDKTVPLIPRRLNNREFANSVADVLLIEDPGTHLPLGDLPGDSLYEGFDTNADTLGLSEFHLEQYIRACRKIVDGVILSGDQPKSQKTEILAKDFLAHSLSQRTSRQGRAIRRDDYVEFTDPRVHIGFRNFPVAPKSGWYRLKIRAAGIDRGYYPAERTGIYDGDPIRLEVRLGDRRSVFDLPDADVKEIELKEWLAAGSRVQLIHPTDGLKQIGNGNFKFQNRIAHDFIKQHQPDLFQHVSEETKNSRRRRKNAISHWSHWVDYWRGPRPRIYSAEVEGPLYGTWPSKRQRRLLGKHPDAEDAVTILKPIAQRAWRRRVRDGELDSIVRLVKDRKEELGDIEALKEGIVAILVSPSFLILNSGEGTRQESLAARISYFFESRPPSKRINDAVQSERLDEFDHMLAFVQEEIRQGHAKEFLDEFPRAWLQLDRINFMAPDPDQFLHFHRKDVSEDMILEATTFFRHAVENNISIPEMLTADYSFVNADLAEVYELNDVPDDSVMRKYQFKDGRRGGLLGMGAFLTLTADSLGTSPIHRAVYVLENFLGTSPAAPPGDIEIPEPDVRSARTIKEVLKAHTADESCASCHRSIDPYGYAFENFGPSGEWRDDYVQMIASDKTVKEAKVAVGRKRRRPVPIQTTIDSSSLFRNGQSYSDIIEFRKQMSSAANQERFVRCFVGKLFVYANGEHPSNFSETERIMKLSAKHNYRVVETLTAVLSSPLFRE